MHRRHEIRSQASRIVGLLITCDRHIPNKLASPGRSRGASGRNRSFLKGLVGLAPLLSKQHTLHQHATPDVDTCSQLEE